MGAVYSHSKINWDCKGKISDTPVPRTSTTWGLTGLKGEGCWFKSRCGQKLGGVLVAAGVAGTPSQHHWGTIARSRKSLTCQTRPICCSLTNLFNLVKEIYMKSQMLLSQYRGGATVQSHFCRRSLCWLTTPTESPTRHLICGGQPLVLLTFVGEAIWEFPCRSSGFFPFFSFFSLFPCLSSLNLSSSCCSVARPVLFSAVRITVPFSCQETEYDEDMQRGKEHLLNHHALNI